MFPTALHCKKSFRKNTVPNVPNSIAQEIMENNDKFNNFQENKALIPPVHWDFYTKIRESTKKKSLEKSACFSLYLRVLA